jgi:hypothetical protein
VAWCALWLKTALGSAPRPPGGGAAFGVDPDPTDFPGIGVFVARCLLANMAWATLANGKPQPKGKARLGSGNRSGPSSGRKVTEVPSTQLREIEVIRSCVRATQRGNSIPGVAVVNSRDALRNLGSHHAREDMPNLFSIAQ